MSQATAQNVVIATIIVTGAVVAWDGINKQGKASPSGKTLVALSLVAAILLVGVGVAPELIGPLALLIGLSIIISRVGA